MVSQQYGHVNEYSSSTFDFESEPRIPSGVLGYGFIIDWLLPTCSTKSQPYWRWLKLVLCLCHNTPVFDVSVNSIYVFVGKRA